MIDDAFCSVSFETSHEVLGSEVSKVRVSNSGGVREREKETKEGCATERNLQVYVNRCNKQNTPDYF